MKIFERVQRVAAKSLRKEPCENGLKSLGFTKLEESRTSKRTRLETNNVEGIDKQASKIV